ncbi:Condensin complex subunit 3 [Fasciolopsis buskii]|uniref:Condensin complex subunit 3 n=1 Tax=Fasciolopsis buskii TaxID=27845 RepID=A0A8E0VJ18_9TREM|nr:Condensin complex subunit 3 [Fasciolopsis buski]
MQIIQKLLEGIGDNGVMPDELYTSLQSVLLRRVQDTKSTVRVQAIHALSRMQDPTDAECRAVETFLWLARHDPTADVRRAALAAMVLTTRTLPSLIERCRDVSDSVRRTAYKILATRGVLRPLSIAKRIRVLQDGLTDRSAEVRQAAQELVISWFKATENDPVKLLRRLDTEGVPETSQLMLDNLFSVLSKSEFSAMVQAWATNYLNEERILKNDCITSEASFFWRALIELLVKQQSTAVASLNGYHVVRNNGNNNSKPKVDSDPDHLGDDSSQEADAGIPLLEMVMPSVTAYVSLITELVNQLVTDVQSEEFDEHTMELECVVVQVLQIASTLDLTDEFGRRSLVALVRKWITSQTVPSTLSPPLLKLHAMLEPNLRKRVNDVVEMISELCDPVEPLLPSPPANLLQPTAADTPANADATPNTNTAAMTSEKSARENVVLSKVDERNIRLKIAKIEVRLNELSESLHDCIMKKNFECATGLRDQVAELEVERSSLMRQLHGNNVTQANLPKDDNGCSAPSVGSENLPKTDIVAGDGAGPLVDPNEVDDDAHANEEGPNGLLDRCSATVLLKANRLASLVVQQSRTLWRLPASLRSLLDSLILPSIQHGDPSVRNQAILALGMCCSMDLPLSLQYISLFYSAMRVDHAMISETALRCIIDCLLIFGFRPFHEAKIRPGRRIATSGDIAVPTDPFDDDDDDEEEDNGNNSINDFVALIRQDGVSGTSAPARREDMSKTVTRFIKPIVALLDSEDDDLQTTSALGLAKLLIYDRLVSSQVLSQLLLLWFNPITEDRPAIRRGLACFFTDYACGSPVQAVNTNRNRNSSKLGNFSHQAALAESVLPTLIALIRAPASSPLSEVEPADVAGLLARLTDATHWHQQEQLEKHVTTETQSGAEREDVGEDGEDLDSHTPAVKEADIGRQNPPANRFPEMKDNPHHDRLALQLASEILKAPQSAEAKLYLRMLCQLHPSLSNLAVHKELLLLCDAMFKFADRSTTLLLHRFRKLINENLESIGLSPDQLLAELKHKALESECSSPSSNSPTSKRVPASEMYSSVRRFFDPNQPTLIGSARPNVHVLDDSGDGPLVSPMNPRGQSNRTLSVLGKYHRYVYEYCFKKWIFCCHHLRVIFDSCHQTFPAV